MAAAKLHGHAASREEGAEGAPDGRIGGGAPDEQVDEEAVAWHYVLLMQRVCRQTCTRDGDAPPLERVAFGSRWEGRWGWRWCWS